MPTITLESGFITSEKQKKLLTAIRQSSNSIQNIHCFILIWEWLSITLVNIRRQLKAIRMPLKSIREMRMFTIIWTLCLKM